LRRERGSGTGSSQLDNQLDSQLDSLGSQSTGKKRKLLEYAKGRSQIAPFPHGSVAESVLPTSLRELLNELQAAANGLHPMISRSRQEEIVGAFPTFKNANFFFETEAGQATPTYMTETCESPALDAVHEIKEIAEEYDYLKCDEAGWNVAVHFPLMRLALPRGGLVDVRPW
jgi:hypothetical protein